MLRRVLTLLVIALTIVPLQVLAQGLSADRPNDPGYAEQWYLETIAAPCAWRHTIGSADVLVAVVDTGIDLSHPDLAPNIASSGYDFVADDSDASDENGHGTNVAGIIAAVTHNGEGIAGVSGGVKILPVRVLNATGAGSDATIARGVRYAADQGARVINLSLGSLLPVDSEQTVAAIRYAYDQGALVVIAAGNSYLPIPNFALGLEKFALIVAATDANDRKIDFSNYGPWVSVSAPGREIYSTMPTYDVFLTSDALPPEQRFQKNYDTMSGTSQATPVVAAVSALLFSAHPDWGPDQVKAEIQNTAADIRDANPRNVVFRPEYLGAGRIDACEALGRQPGGAVGPTSGPDRQHGWPPAAIPAILALVLLVAAVVLMRRRLAPSQPAGYAPVPQRPGGFQPGPSPGGTPSAAPPCYRPSPTPPQQPTAAAAPRAAAASRGRLVIVQGPGQGRSFTLAPRPMHLGRSPETDLALSEDPAVSRQHARLTFHGSRLVVEDLGSTHGTYVNGQRIARPTPLRPGDIIHIGETTLVFEA